MRSAALPNPELLRPSSLEEAVSELARLSPDAAPLAGATWVMRAPLRNERLKSHYVALQGIDELRRVERGDQILIGTLVTHSELAQLDAGIGSLGALAEAARRSAFPAVRNVATIGGNICASPFPEADLVPALLASEAKLELASAKGSQTLDVAPFLAARAEWPLGDLVTCVRVPTPAERRSWFERLTVRASGEYAVASVAVSVDLDGDGRTTEARLAVGSVTETPQRSTSAEEILSGSHLDEAVGEEAGRAAAHELKPRDDLDAPGWYRLAVLPALVRRAVARIAESPGGERT